jgi:predicted 3-demethylubiquinone-9 3-methyltransferase (glyoxalase superfamily)
MDTAHQTTQKITTFLTFNNQAEQALNHYLSIFKGSKVIQSERIKDARFGEVGTLFIATIEIFGQKYMLLNGGPHFTFTDGISLMVHCDSQEEIDEYWEKLTSDGGKEIQCGWLVDKFGVSWQIVPSMFGELMSSGDSAISQRVMNAVMQMVKIDINTLLQAYKG